MNADLLEAKALRLARSTAPLPGRVRDGLVRLTSSVRQDAQLHPLAERALTELVLSGLVARLRLDASPSPSAPSSLKPVVICGLPRTGTTLLQHLLCLSPDARPVPLWELYDPLPNAQRPRESVRRALGWLRRGDIALEGLHAVHEDLSDECSLLMRLDLRSQLFWACAPVESYLDWLLQEDLDETYRVYRRALGVLRGRRPGRMILKCPAHALQLPALRSALPDAKVLVCHRNPDDAVPSSHKVLQTMHVAVSPDRDSARSRERNTRRLREQAEATVKHADLADLHLAHGELVADPVTAVLRVCAAIGLAPPDEALLRQTVSRNPRPPRTAPSHPAPGFSAYRARFAGLLD